MCAGFAITTRTIDDPNKGRAPGIMEIAIYVLYKPKTNPFPYLISFRRSNNEIARYTVSVDVQCPSIRNTIQPI